MAQRAHIALQLLQILSFKLGGVQRTPTSSRSLAAFAYAALHQHTMNCVVASLAECRGSSLGAGHLHHSSLPSPIPPTLARAGRRRLDLELSERSSTRCHGFLGGLFGRCVLLLPMFTTAAAPPPLASSHSLNSQPPSPHPPLLLQQGRLCCRLCRPGFR